MNKRILAIALASVSVAIPAIVSGQTAANPNAIVNTPEGPRRAGGVINPNAPPATVPSTQPFVVPLTPEQLRLLTAEERRELLLGRDARLGRALTAEERRELLRLQQEELRLKRLEIRQRQLDRRDERERLEDMDRNTSLDDERPVQKEKADDVGRGPLDSASGAVISSPPGGQGNSKTGGTGGRGALDRPSGGAISPPPAATK